MKGFREDCLRRVDFINEYLQYYTLDTFQQGYHAHHSNRSCCHQSVVTLDLNI